MIQNLREFEDNKKRREALNSKLNLKLESIAKFSFTEEQVSGRNIENLVGAVQIPLGVAW